MPLLERPLTRVCLRLWKDDYEAIREMSQSNGEVGINLTIRQIVHSYVTQMQALKRRNLDQLPKLAPVEFDLSELEKEI